jgi:hypothetical protein
MGIRAVVANSATNGEQTMKDTWKKFSWFAFVVAITFVITTQALQAAPPSGGKFKLPFDVQLGKMTLPSGDYTFSLQNNRSTDGTIFVYRGNNTVGIVQPQIFNSNEDRSKNPVLICNRHHGNVTVRALTLPNVGTFYFPLPKEPKNIEAQKPTQQIETALVKVTGE